MITVFGEGRGFRVIWLLEEMGLAYRFAGDTFTAADISVTYAPELAHRSGAAALGEAERAYVARTSGREAYQRAMEHMSRHEDVGR